MPFTDLADMRWRCYKILCRPSGAGELSIGPSLAVWCASVWQLLETANSTTSSSLALDSKKTKFWRPNFHCGATSQQMMLASSITRLIPFTNAPIGIPIGMRKLLFHLQHWFWSPNYEAIKSSQTPAFGAKSQN